ncbi:CRISPR system precrRNA processing endoribonuclease RAMP protein Cas6 [Sulfolobus acidocaldarius]|nr:CRISPR system precrRNA processing endoribonuclease RAMP protein Cas6 [Sulfolobus acidocaldarius]
MYKLVKIKVNIPTPFITNDYTGKFVKTVLINANPDLQEVFEGKKKVQPKPMRVTSLLDENNEAVYPKHIVNRFEMDHKPNLPPKPITIKGKFSFYLGYDMSLEPEVSKVMTSLFSGLQMKYGEFNVELKAIEYNQVEFDNFPSEFSQIKVKLITPSMFKDPFEKLADLDRVKYRRYLPFPAFIFSTNVFEIFRETYKRNIIRLSYGLLESHNNLNTVRKVWYYYDGKWLPGVVGYLKFFVRKGLRKEVMNIFREIFIHANIMGVGTGRAAGFGFAEITAK